MNIEKLRNFEPIFGEWYIDKKLSEGRSSVFYRVFREKNGRTDYLGLKTIRFPRTEADFNRIMQSGRYSDPEEYLKVLESELRRNMDKMMSLRANSSIVRFDDYMIVREFNCFHVIILMQELRPLSEHLTEKRATSREIAKLGLDISKALAGFRKEGIIHREIKPENIFVSDSGEYLLGDFGISSMSETGDMQEGLSIYLAPEILRRDAPDSCSDIYSLGLLMYKLINNNRVPFLPPYPAPISVDDRKRAFERRMSGEQLPPPSKAAPQLSRIILTACSFDVGGRYHEPEKLEEDLRDFLFGAMPTGYVPKVSAYRGGGDDLYFDSRTDGKSADTAQNSAKREFDEAFADDDEPDNKNTKKKVLIAALVIVSAAVCVAIGIMLGGFFGGRGGNEPLPELTTSAPAEETTAESTAAPTENETDEVLTESSKPAEPESTEPDTQKPAEAESTTKPSAEKTEAQPPAEEPTLFVSTGHEAGTAQKDGRRFEKLMLKASKMMLTDGEITEAEIVFEDFGKNPKAQSGKTFICQVDDSGIVISREEAPFGILYDDLLGKGNVECKFAINREVYYEDGMSYYLVFEEGAVVSDTSYSLPMQVKLEKAE